MNYEATGTLYKIFEAEQITQRFRKRELVVEITGRYPQLVSFELTGDRCEELDAFSVGDEVAVEFRLRGREWTSRSGEVRYFNSLDVQALRKVGDSPPAADADADPFGAVPPPTDADAPADDPEEDDIPF